MAASAAGLAWETRLGAMLPGGNEGDIWESVLHTTGDGHILYSNPSLSPSCDVARVCEPIYPHSLQYFIVL